MTQQDHRPGGDMIHVSVSQLTELIREAVRAELAALPERSHYTSSVEGNASHVDNPASRREVFSPNEAAQYLGLSLSTVYKMIHNRVIPYSKPGGKHVFICKGYLDEWLKSARVKSREELEQAAETHEAIRKRRS